MKKHPALISIPHGGARVPDEIRDAIQVDMIDIYDDIDLFTPEIYNVGELVESVIISDVARTIVDLNRATDDLPPSNPDGVIKSSNFQAKQIYYPGKEPDAMMIEHLIRTYYEPYHESISKALENEKIKIAFDCHSMVPVGPAISPDKGKKRPLFCLGNSHGKSCPDDIVEKLANCMREAFAVETNDITINKPFSGGYITRKYGNNPVPWIQIEMNKALYLDEDWMDKPDTGKNVERLNELNRNFASALNLFFHEIS